QVGGRAVTIQPGVWTGSRFLEWGMPTSVDADEESDDTGEAPATPPAGAAYDPAANAWQPVAAGPLRGRLGHTAVWTGQQMLVWGGQMDDTAPGLADGASFRP
ncbi:MAG TPA: hypothetical protein VHL53_20875, partial [Acidimicrobiia bacterium]|nr:hypothetical protein [Acidimicrobiia bacterium]